MIIFGWGKKIVRQVGPYRCRRCDNTSWWVLCSVITFFTLFFMPIIPYAVDYRVICPRCKNAVKLDRDQFKELAITARRNRAT
jgi:hypothetical protein